jgi:metal-responsive CopG/Arc/MetJ family transcriptional regulator
MEMPKKWRLEADGFTAVRIPSGLIEKVDKLVEKKMFANRASGVVALITAGLKDYPV